MDENPYKAPREQGTPPMPPSSLGPTAQQVGGCLFVLMIVASIGLFLLVLLGTLFPPEWAP